MKGRPQTGRAPRTVLESGAVSRGIPAPVVVFGVFFTLYGATAAHTTQGFDSGEFVAVADSWGVAHPPGFPTFTILSGLWVRALSLSADYALSLGSAAAGAAACAWLVAFLRRVGVRLLAAGAAAAAWGLTAQSWMLHTSQEVFATAHAALALLLWLHAPSSRARDGSSARLPPPMRAFGLGLAFGLAAGVHTLVVWFLPIAVQAVWTLSSTGRRRVSTPAAWGTGVIAGSAVFLYPLWAWQGSGLEWRDSGDLVAASRHALRLDYGALSLGTKSGPFGFALREYADHVLLDGGPLILFLVAGIYAAVRPRPRSAVDPGVSRGRAVALLLSFVLSAPVFIGLFRLPPNAWSAGIVARFFPQADLYAAVFVALALDAALRVPQRTLVAGTWLAASVFPLYVAGRAVPYGPSIGRVAIEANAAAALDSVEAGGVLIGRGDSFIAAVWERQFVHAQRRDVTFVAASLLPAPWYADRVHDQIGYAHPPRMAGVSRLIAYLHERDVPVYVSTSPSPGLSRRFHFVPEGVALRALPRHRRPPPAPWVEGRLGAFFAEHPPPGLFPWQRVRVEEEASFEAYVRPWRALCGTYRAAEDSARLERCEERLRRLAEAMPASVASTL